MCLASKQDDVLEEFEIDGRAIATEPEDGRVFSIVAIIKDTPAR
jgi:hypothetical protein